MKFTDFKPPFQINEHFDTIIVDSNRAHVIECSYPDVAIATVNALNTMYTPNPDIEIQATNAAMLKYPQYSTASGYFQEGFLACYRLRPAVDIGIEQNILTATAPKTLDMLAADEETCREIVECYVNKSLNPQFKFVYAATNGVEINWNCQIDNYNDKEYSYFKLIICHNGSILMENDDEECIEVFSCLQICQLLTRKGYTAKKEGENG
jgi:hypothetical protein